MAQRAFVRIAGIDPIDTQATSVRLRIEVAWYGDQLASGGDPLDLVIAHTATAQQINTAITNAAIARALELGVTVNQADVLFIDRVT